MVSRETVSNETVSNEMVSRETSKAMFHVKPCVYDLIDLKAAYFLSFRMRAGICPASVSFF